MSAKVCLFHDFCLACLAIQGCPATVSSLESQLTARCLPDVQAPAFHPPSDEQFFSPQDRTKPNIQFLKQHFYREGRLSEEQALAIIDKGTEILRSEPNLLHVDAPVTGACLFDDQSALLAESFFYSVR